MSEDDELWKDLPLFAPDSSCVPKLAKGETAEHLPEAVGALSHLLYDEETPQEIAENLREQGNTFFKRGTKEFYKRAIEKYTASLNAGCSNPEVVGPAYSNRAAANLKLKNYGKALHDAEAALKYDADHIKSRYRAVVGANALGKHEKVLTHCDAGLRTLRRQHLENSQDAKLFRKSRAEAEVRLQKVADAAARAEKRKTHEDSRALGVSRALAKRRVTMGLPLFAQQRTYKKKTPELEVEGGTPALVWPLLVVYPDVAGTGVGEQSDYMEQVSELATFDDILSALFPDGGQPPEWDVSGLYSRRADKLICRYREGWTKKSTEADSDDERDFVGTNLGPNDVGDWVSVARSTTLGQLVSRKNYVVPLFPVIYVLPA